jgi:hypothetical protein
MKKRMVILKITATCFDYGTKQAKQGIAELCPKRFDSSLRVDTHSSNADNKKVKNRTEMFNLKLSLQGRDTVEQFGQT